MALREYEKKISEPEYSILDLQEKAGQTPKEMPRVKAEASNELQSSLTKPCFGSKSRKGVCGEAARVT
jgi:hypothetical protein